MSYPKIDANTPNDAEMYYRKARPLPDYKTEEDNSLEFETILFRDTPVAVKVIGEYLPFRPRPYMPADFIIESVNFSNGEPAELFETEKAIIKVTAIEIMVNRP